MFIAFDEIRGERRDWELNIPASALAEVLSKTLSTVPEQALPQQLTDALRLLDDRTEEHYWRNYY